MGDCRNGRLINYKGIEVLIQLETRLGGIKGQY